MRLAARNKLAAQERYVQNKIGAGRHPMDAEQLNALMELRRDAKEECDETARAAARS